MPAGFDIQMRRHMNKLKYLGIHVFSVIEAQDRYWSQNKIYKSFR